MPRMRVHLDNADDAAAPAVEGLIRAHYDDFNTRRLDAAATRFHPEARIEHVTGQVEYGPDGFRRLAHQWLTAFPDVRVTVQQIRPQGGGMYDVNLTATGTHVGTLALGAWSFRASRGAVSIAARELLHVEHGLFRLASLTFDLQDLVRQLAVVDTAKLQEHITRLHQLGERLAAEPDPTRQRELIERLGSQLDAARHIVRPYFRPTR
jgi:SnoaL-like polyketide cyclase